MSAVPVSRRLLRGYGPLLAMLVVFALMAALVPTVGDKVKTVEVAVPVAGGDGAIPDGAPPEASGGEAAAAPGAGPAATSGAAAAARPGTRSATTVTTIAGRAATPTARAQGGPAAAASAPAGSTPAGSAAPVTVPAGARPCPDRAQQVRGDTYSPPCITFSGDNGGATYRGVSASEINVTVRMASLPDFSAAPSDSGPSSVFKVDREEIERTLQGLVEYFNTRFQLFGRKLKLTTFEGEGSFLTELQGGGQEKVEADAVKATEELKAFADLSGITAPYADALARREVINIGAPYMSAEWMKERAPYVWSQFTDCTYIVSTVADWMNKRVAGKPARLAGGNLKGQPRKIALIAPENPWYQQCADAGQKVLEQAGNKVTTRIAYKLDLNTLSNQAASAVAKLRNDGITTVVCGCDPAFPIFLTSKAQEQDYQPEWTIVGAAYVDFDVFGQLYQQDQWARSFGVSFLGTLTPLRSGYGYAAFKAVRPNEEPSSLVDLLYYQVYLLAIGIQGAGPNLNPETFSRGMYAYPGGSGLVGTWKFEAGRQTPTVDAREIYYDRDKVSVQNNEKGAYVETEPGKRYRPGQFPAGEPPIPSR